MFPWFVQASLAASSVIYCMIQDGFICSISLKSWRGRDEVIRDHGVRQETVKITK